MPNIIDATGIQIKTISEVIASLTATFIAIYGDDVNLESNSPDGQLLYNFALIVIDFANLIVQDYDSKDPDQAVGVSLDGVSQLAGITRNGGTYTQVNITVTTDRSLNLVGTDGTTPFTVTDGTNSFELVTSASLTTGANVLAFQCTEIGNVQISLNTLTTIATPVLGVLTVNNPSAPTQQGTDQETDAAFRIRRAASVSLPAQGSINGLIGGLLTISGLTDCSVLENTDASADGDGIPGHGIWVITQGGVNADIAEMIYLYRPCGVPMAGAVTVDIEQVDGSDFTVSFDHAVPQNLYMALTIVSKSGGTIDPVAIKNGLVDALSYGIYDIADISSIIAAVYAINPDAVVSSAGVSNTAGSYLPTKLPAAKKNYWVLTSTNIAIS